VNTTPIRHRSSRPFRTLRGLALMAVAIGALTSGCVLGYDPRYEPPPSVDPSAGSGELVMTRPASDGPGWRFVR